MAREDRVDAAFALARLNESAAALMEDGDFEGAEELLSAAFIEHPKFTPFLHFQMGRLYRRWNKLTSAIHHLHHAVEATQAQGQDLFLIQILEELNLAKRDQSSQKP